MHVAHFAMDGSDDVWFYHLRAKPRSIPLISQGVSKISWLIPICPLASTERIPCLDRSTARSRKLSSRC